MHHDQCGGRSKIYADVLRKETLQRTERSEQFTVPLESRLGCADYSTMQRAAKPFRFRPHKSSGFLALADMAGTSPPDALAPTW